MGAGVGKCPDLVVVASNDQHRKMRDVVYVVVAWLRNVFLAAGPLPSLCPNLFHFQIIEFLRCIAVKGEVGVAQKLKRMLTERRGNMVAIAIELVLYRRARTAGSARCKVSVRRCVDIVFNVSFLPNIASRYNVGVLKQALDATLIWRCTEALLLGRVSLKLAVM